MTTALASLLVACSHTPLSQQLTADEKSQIEPVYQFDIAGSKVTFIVKSHGCTMPEHFELKQSVSFDNKVELALLRLKPDWCRAMPRAYPVSFTLKKQVKQQDLMLLNPLDENNKLPRNKVNNRR